MRLAYFTTEYPAVSHTFIRRELMEMERRGHDILRLSIRQSKPDLPDPLDRAERDKTVAVLGDSAAALLRRAFAFAAGSPVAFCRGLWLALKMSGKSDRGLIKHMAYCIEAASIMGRLKSELVEHVHVHFGTNAAAVARLTRRMGGPSYSMTCHGPDEFDAVIGLDLPGKISDAAFVVGISDYGAAQLKRWLRADQWSKVHVVRCTVEDSLREETPVAIPESPTFVCVGRLTAQKGQLVLLDALAQLRDAGSPVKLVFAGDGELRRDLEASITSKRLEGLVTITGWLSGRNIREQINLARALVLPSFAEGLPVAIMEAMALGRPIISTSVAGIPELVRAGRNGWLIPPGRVDLLAAAIGEAAAASTEELTAMGRLAREDVARLHDIGSEADKLEPLLLGASLRQPSSSAGRRSR